VTRGKKPEVAIFDAKEFAERMGYMPIDNPKDQVPAKCPDWQTDDDLGSRKCNGKSPEETVPTQD
jgi:hypothetical protein